MQTAYSVHIFLIKTYSKYSIFDKDMWDNILVLDT